MWLSIAASLALVVSVCLLAYNLFATRKDARRNLAFSMMEQLTSATFAERRWKMRQTIGEAAKGAWIGFDDSLEDFECRAFAYQYELIAQMVASGTLDYGLVRDSLRFTIVSDWIAFDPLDVHLTMRYPNNPSPWESFRKLAERITFDLRGPAIPPRVPAIGSNGGSPTPAETRAT